MGFTRFLRVLIVTAGAVLLVLLQQHAVLAQTTSSTSYKSNEYFFGNGGEVDLNGTAYKARGSSGGLGVDNSNSTNYTSKSGFLTAQDEYLEMVVTSGTVNLGNLSTSTPATATGAFYVRAYTSSGYIVKTISGTPTSGVTSLAGMSSATTSSPGTEQYGINLVANTAPSTFGANPAAQPSGYAYGAAAAGYSTSNNYKYVAGDTIASAPKGIGQTNFTISYLANISIVSKAGLYSVNQILVVVAGY